MTGMVQDKVILVTGGSTGIGRETARILAREGATVVIADVQDEDGARTVDGIVADGGGAEYRHVDVSDYEAVRALVAGIAERHGGLDCAFNNAGIEGPTAKIMELPLADWQRVIAVNLTGVWHCMKYELRHMLKHGGGSIINTASVAGLVGMSHAAAYSAAKAGVIGLTKNAAIEYARDNIRINAVCPGGVRTQMTESADRSLPGFLDRIAKLEPMGRVAEPEEIASAVVWLASDGASFMTGHALPVDGGFVAR